MNDLDLDVDTHIAVIGMACRLPGANSPVEFWANLVDGVDSVRPIPVEERRSWGEDEAWAADPRHVAMHGLVDGVGDFDAEFFGCTPRDAAVLNPQQQMFLECAWEALERAGYHPGEVPGPVGVYAGAGRNGYGRIVLERPDLLPGVDVMAATIANEPEHLCTQVSYRLGLTGPGVTVQTACSSSLVAVHEAARALLAGDCDMALAGGITIRLPRVGYRYQEGGTMSPDGRCRTFSADAKGIVAGDGAGIVVLRRLQDALDDGDTVHAVLIGSAVNNDGRDRAGYTAPGLRGQTEVIRLAHTVAGVTPESIGYVESHGTGTPVGDPIEVAALTKAFTSPSTRPGSVMLGAVKSNIGHTDTAAGVAGLIKATLALENRFVPGNLHFTEPNPRVDFASGPFTVPTAGVDWTAADDRPRRAGVSSFGIGGTNAHVVLQEAPRRTAEPDPWPVHILPLAARTPTALDAMAERLAAHLARHPDQPLADVAHTLQTGRQAFPYRRFVVCADHESASAALAGAPSTGRGAVTAAEPSVLFRLPGTDVPARVLLDELAAVFPVFRVAADECAAALSGHDGEPAALFTLRYALVQLWQDWGVRPDSWHAEGAGELVVACRSGAIDLATAARLLRGQEGEEKVVEVPSRAEEAGSLVVDLPETGPGGAVAALLAAAGRLWQAGAPVDWRAVARGTRRRRVPLPTYPFQRRHVAIRPAAPIPVETTDVAGDEQATPAETAGSAQSTQRPQSVAERLSVLFQQVLGAGDESADFFELGGDSLAAVQLVALIEETFGVTPPVDVVFDTPAVPDLSLVIEGLIAEAAAEAS
ncbi:beta-ketoacyl synthase N-terminal-like domain-containing protein [Streptomyces sp. NPDC007205]|uniref:beta-ketoacyl synthase N-terminal-like domain-containing protein n=1 Tax=Streptomyces sp. NPDC007205 TaxID=3154316 RepID=UPI0034019F2F